MAELKRTELSVRQERAILVGVILPDTKSSVRWETKDRPALEEAFKAAGVDYTIQNAEGSADTMATIADTYTYNVYRNAAALEKLKKDSKVTVHDTPKEVFTAFLKATNVVYDREAGKNPFFKEVLDSQRTFAKTVVPYWTRINGLYYTLGNESANRD